LWIPPNRDILLPTALEKPWAEVWRLEVQLGRFGRGTAGFGQVVAVPHSYRRLEGNVAAGLGNYYRMVGLQVEVVDIAVEGKVAGIVVDKEVVDIAAVAKEGILV
jgi:hypothetical protein